MESRRSGVPTADLQLLGTARQSLSGNQRLAKPTETPVHESTPGTHRSPKVSWCSHCHEHHRVAIHLRIPPPFTVSKASPAVAMADKNASVVLVSTTLVSVLSGFLLGVYSVRGYLLSPALVEERRRNLKDPVESDESDVDEDDTILDHAPNWANGEDADRRDGLRAAQEKKEKPKPATTPAVVPVGDTNEECKLVLVVRTDLGMTKGE